MFGIKGENVFCQLTDIPDNLPIDWMHCVCKGILKRHAAIQMVVQSSVCCRFKQFAIGISHELDNMFLSIKVPHDFTRKPCSIAELKHWKASEFHLFALFAGLPYPQYAVLSEEFGTDHFYHFALYCSSFPALSSYFQTLCRGGSSFG